MLKMLRYLAINLYLINETGIIRGLIMKKFLKFFSMPFLLNIFPNKKIFFAILKISAMEKMYGLRIPKLSTYITVLPLLCSSLAKCCLLVKYSAFKSAVENTINT